MVRIRRSHRRGRGSIPRQGIHHLFLFFETSEKEVRVVEVILTKLHEFCAENEFILDADTLHRLFF